MSGLKIATIVKAHERDVWLESDFLGSISVMVKHNDGKHDAFNYCTFHYDHRYTFNSSIHVNAENMAIALGAKHPVRCVNVGLDGVKADVC